ncbi:MAG: FG-GAP-like repeat-containing protein [Vicinamibacterales bacterium]
MRYIITSIACVALALLGLAPEPRALVQTPSTAQSAGVRENAYRANNRGVAFLEQFNYPDAAQAFGEALKIYPDLAIARLNLAIALLYEGNPAEAVVAARQAAEKMSDAPQAHFVLGLAARADDKLDVAVSAFSEVLKLDPTDAGTKIHLGQIRLQQRQYPEALRLFQEAAATEPYNVTAAYNVALALGRAGRGEEGRTAMQRFEALRDSAYGVTYAQTYLAQGRYGEAIASTGAEPDLVDAATPDVTFADATASALPSGASPAAGSAAGSVMLVDVDGDSDLDLIEAGERGLRLLKNAKGVFTDDTARARLEVSRDNALTVAVAGDVDNDGKPDLFAAGKGSHRLLRQSADNTFEDVTAKAGLGAPPAAARAAAFADVDHDGDVDLLIASDALKVFQNNGDGTFTDIAAKAGLASAGSPAAIVPTDFDNRRDIDLVLVGGERPQLFRNMRDGSFHESGADVGLPPASGGVVAAADVNKDGYPDFFFGRGASPGVFALSDGQGRFRTADAPAGTADAMAAQFFDYDNDGLLDLAAATRDRVQVLRNVGGGRWTNVSAAARATAFEGAAIGALALGDIDADGDTDLVGRQGGALKVFRNEGGSRRSSLRVQLVARASNRTAAGAKVEMRAGSLRQVLETSSAVPAAAPADLVFGLGARKAVDVVRVLWPSGILQAETSQDPSVPGAAQQAGIQGSVTITELDRKPSSCPYLFTWNGTRFEFVTDFMGGGEMGAWQGPGLWNRPDPDEYVRIRGDQLLPRDGRYELRMTNELEEALFIDRAQLVAVDHPADVQVYPNEGLKSSAGPFRLHATRGARPPLSARDDHGHDVLSRLSHLDRRYPDDFDLLPIRGYAEPHALVLDLGAVPDRATLLMTGWTDYAFSNDNVAAAQGGRTMTPPSLQVRDSRGQWKTVVEEIGFPVGRPQTVAVDLTEKFLSPSREVRILTSMRIYWDQILVGGAADLSFVRTTRLEPIAADLRWRGLSQEVTPDGREPYSYDYHRVSAAMPWKVMVGRYTREGDVRPLVGSVDDLFVISRPGDEVALAFEVLPPVAPGMARTFLLYAHGYSKEMNPRSATPDTVGPMPFRAMSGYPYGPGEHFPRRSVHREYMDEFNTRVVRSPWPSLDALVYANRPARRPVAREGGVQ